MLDHVIEIPVFTGPLQCTRQLYRLSSVLIHLGDTPDSGHYQNIFCRSDNLEFFIGDDDTSALPMDGRAVSKYGRDMYILVYSIM